MFRLMVKVEKVKVKECHSHEECKRGAHLHFLGCELVDG